MKLKIAETKSNVYFFLIGILILIPFSVEILNAEFFIFQITGIFLIFGIVVLLKKKIRIWNVIDKLILASLFWSFISYVVYFYNLFGNSDLDKEMLRFKSLIVTLSLYLSYFLGKMIFTGTTNSVKPFYKGIFLCFMLGNLYFFSRFMQMGFSDLMKTREIMLQRIPMVIAFVSVIALVIGVRDNKKKYLLFFFLPGLILVFLSMTRAVYLQVGLSILVFLIWYFRKKPKTIILIAVILVAFGGVLNLKNNYTEQIATRILSFSSSSGIKKDVSSTYRLKQWKTLWEKTSEDPLTLVFGHGQLGATNISTNVDKTEQSSAHNQYLDTWVREGFIGLFLFLGLLLYIIYFGLASGSGIPEQFRSFVFANSIGLIGVFFYGFFHESVRYYQFGYYFMFYAGMLSWMLDEGKNPNKEIQHDEKFS